MTLGVEQMRNIVWSSRSSEQGDTVSVSLYVSLKQWIHRPADSTLPRAQDWPGWSTPFWWASGEQRRAAALASL